MDTSASTQRHSVEQLADAFMASYRAGKCPTVEEYAAQYPELADQLRSLLAALVLLEQNVPPADNHYAANGTSGHELREIGDFKIVGEIGRGGMGIVYEAIEQSLGRRVALKVMSTAGLLNPVHLERFRSEARAAARLSHNHIVPVYGVGQCKGLHYYAMQFIQGESLDEVIGWLRQLRRDEGSGEFVVGPRVNRKSDGLDKNGSENGTVAAETKSVGQSQTNFSSSFSNSSSGPEFYRHVARLALGIAEALAYAHSEGVLHRDIKPSNLLLDEKGNIWITDFGLAQAEGAEKLTQTGDFVGTLRYMAPERFEGWSDRRSDVYSLGASLYELLTLQPFMQSENRAQMIERILHDRPVSLSRIDSAIPRDLETIVLKAIAKEPAARYHTADEMAEDLRRFLADRPILARRSTGAERFGRWCRRNPLVATLSFAVILLLVTTIAVLAISNAQIRRESLAKEKAMEDREAALSDRNVTRGKSEVIFGLYGPDNKSEDKILQHLNEAVKLDPNSAENLWLRGFEFGFLNRWDEALRDMTKARPLLGKSKLISPADRDWFVAMVHVAKGDRVGYQSECRAALMKIDSETRLRERSTLLWMCTVTPDALDSPRQLADYANAVLSDGDKTSASDELLAAGAAFYRAGKFSEAQQRLQQALTHTSKDKWFRFPMSELFANLFLAMSDARLGSVDEAQTSFETADHLAQTVKPSCWVEQLQLSLLMAEAQKTIEAAGVIGVPQPR